MDYRTSGTDDYSLHEITLNPAQAVLRLSGQEVATPIVSASVAHATEAPQPRSAQIRYFNIQLTSVFLRLPQVRDGEGQSLLIIHSLTATQEGILV